MEIYIRLRAVSKRENIRRYDNNCERNLPVDVILIRWIITKIRPSLIHSSIHWLNVSTCTIEGSPDCSMRRFNKSLALFTWYHPNGVSLVNRSHSLFMCTLWHRMFSETFHADLSTAIFLWHLFQWNLFPHPQREYYLQQTFMNAWKKNEWVENGRHFCSAAEAKKTTPCWDCWYQVNLHAFDVYFIPCSL